MDRKYVLQDVTTGTDLSLNAEFHLLVRPGQKLAMAMVFRGKYLQGDIAAERSCCPKCGQQRPFEVPGTDTVWYVLIIFLAS
jgi:hypothetical protein